MVEVTFIVVYLVFFPNIHGQQAGVLLFMLREKSPFRSFYGPYFFPFFLLQKFYIVFYPSYVSICKDLQKTIVLSSGPFLQVFTFTIQCICNL